MIKGLTPHQILGSPPVRERKICSLLEGKTKRWKVSSFINRFVGVVLQKNQCSSELYKVTLGLDFSTFSQTKIGKGYAPFLCQIGFSGGPLPGDFELSKGRKARHWIRTPTHSTSPAATHHRSGSSTEFAGIPSDSERACLVLRRSSRRSSTSKTDQKGSEKEEDKEEELSPTQKKRWIELKQVRTISGTAEIIKENKRSEVQGQCNCCSKRSRLRIVFCICEKETWRIDCRAGKELSNYNWDKLPNHSITRTTSNKSDETNAMAHQKIRFIGDHFRRCTKTWVADPITKQKICFEWCVDRWEKTRCVHQQTFKRKIAKLGCWNERRTRWSWGIPTITSMMWTDTFGKAVN